MRAPPPLNVLCISRGQEKIYIFVLRKMYRFLYKHFIKPLPDTKNHIKPPPKTILMDLQFYIESQHIFYAISLSLSTHFPIYYFCTQNFADSSYACLVYFFSILIYICLYIFILNVDLEIIDL